MKFFKVEKVNGQQLSRPYLLFFALCIALSMWYFVTRHGKTERELEILLNYQNIPQEMLITSDLIHTVHERVQGPRLLLNTLPSSFHLPLDASKIKVGDGSTNTFSVRDELLKVINRRQLRAFSIVDIDHPVIHLHAENRAFINMSLNFRFRGSSEFSIVMHSADRSSVVFTGPENEINKLKEMESWTVDVHVDLLDTGKGRIVKEIPIIIPLKECSHVKAEPSSVSVVYEVPGERVEIIRQYTINLAVANPSLYKVEPEQINLRLKVPAKKQQDTEYLNELRVTALPPNMDDGESRRITLNFTPPEGMEVIDSNKTVTITRLRNSKNIKETREKPVVPLSTNAHSQEKENQDKTKHKRNRQRIQKQE